MSPIDSPDFGGEDRAKPCGFRATSCAGNSRLFLGERMRKDYATAAGARSRRKCANRHGSVQNRRGVGRPVARLSDATWPEGTIVSGVDGAERVAVGCHQREARHSSVSFLAPEGLPIVLVPVARPCEPERKATPAQRGRPPRRSPQGGPYEPHARPR